MTERPTKRSGELVDDNLRRAFKEIEEEELPDRFKDLLARLQSGEEIAASASEEADK